jgi:hypothetical protein
MKDNGLMTVDKVEDKFCMLMEGVMKDNGKIINLMDKGHFF